MAYPKDSRGIHEECLAYELLSGPMGPSVFSNVYVPHNKSNYGYNKII